jgi:hypothetical protein
LIVSDIKPAKPEIWSFLISSGIAKIYHLFHWQLTTINQKSENNKKSPNFTKSEKHAQKAHSTSQMYDKIVVYFPGWKIRP